MYADNPTDQNMLFISRESYLTSPFNICWYTSVSSKLGLPPQHAEAETHSSISTRTSDDRYIPPTRSPAMTPGFAPRDACSASCPCGEWRANWLASYWLMSFSGSNLVNLHQGWKPFYRFSRWIYFKQPTSSFIFCAAFLLISGE